MSNAFFYSGSSNAHNALRCLVESHAALWRHDPVWQPSWHVEIWCAGDALRSLALYLQMCSLLVAYTILNVTHVLLLQPCPLSTHDTHVCAHGCAAAAATAKHHTCRYHY